MKVRKSLSLILALVMVLSLFSFASAANFDDVSSDLEGAVNRLVALGIINGYPDGTFRPDNNITRAEFAKIAVITLGLEKSADLLENVPSDFKDVKVGDWYNKYVNVAANQGILAGYPDGTFKPNNNITQAEALTIVLRMLGYSDNLKGNWPYNYVTEADRIGLIDNDFVASAYATRGGVAKLVNDALSQKLVKWSEDSGEFDFYADGRTLIETSFKGAIVEEVRVSSTLVTKDKYDTLVTIEKNDKDEDVTVTKSVDKDVIVTGGAFDKLRNHIVDYTTKNNVVVAIDVLSTRIAGEVKSVNTYSRVVKIGNNEVVFGDDVDLPKKGDNIAVYIYDGVVYLAELVTEDNVGEIWSVDIKASGVSITLNDFKTFDIAPNAAITLNGSKATVNDLKSGQYIEYELDDDGDIIKLDAFYNVVSGTVDSWEKDGSKYVSITVNGVEYAIADTFPHDETDVVVGGFVMMKLNAQGLVYGFVFDQDDFASTVIGEFDSLSARASTSGSVYYINLKDGTSYDITDAVKAAKKDDTLFVDLKPTSSFNDLNVKGSTVKIGYNAAGEVLAVYVFSPITIIDDFKPVDPDKTIAELEGIIGIFTTYSTNGSGRKADLSGRGIAAYIVTWDAQNGYAKNVDAVEEDYLKVNQVATKGANVLGNYITFEAEGPFVQYYFAEGAEGYYEDIEVGDYVKYAFYESQNAKHIYYLKKLKDLNEAKAEAAAIADNYRADLVGQYVEEITITETDITDKDAVQKAVNTVNLKYAIVKAEFEGTTLTVEVNEDINVNYLEIDTNGKIDGKKVEFKLYAENLDTEDVIALLVEVDSLTEEQVQELVEAVGDASVTFKDNKFTINFGGLIAAVNAKGDPPITKLYLTVHGDGIKYGSMGEAGRDVSAYKTVEINSSNN